jgi:hypothetical protein
VLAVVRSHYGNEPKHLNNREKIYRAGNAVSGWLGLDSWVDIVRMQNPENVAEFRSIVQAAS